MKLFKQSILHATLFYITCQVVDQAFVIAERLHTAPPHSHAQCCERLNFLCLWEWKTPALDFYAFGTLLSRNISPLFTQLAATSQIWRCGPDIMWVSLVIQFPRYRLAWAWHWSLIAHKKLVGSGLLPFANIQLNDMQIWQLNFIPKCGHA